MSTNDQDEQGKTAPIELPPDPAAAISPAPPAPAPAVPTAAPQPLPVLPPPPPEPARAAPFEDRLDTPVAAAPPFASVADVAPPQVVYVPLAVTLGDGFKLGCGFFLASVLAMLVGFVLLAALFLLTTAFGLNLPIGR